MNLNVKFGFQIAKESLMNDLCVSHGYETSSFTGEEEVTARSGDRVTLGQFPKRCSLLFAQISNEFPGHSACFIPWGRSFFTLESNGHYYLLSTKHHEVEQSEVCDAIKFSKEGLTNLRKNMSRLMAPPGLLKIFLGLAFLRKRFIICSKPISLSLFSEEKFLVIPNIQHNTSIDVFSYPKTAKLRGTGLVLGVWFIHPFLDCINSDSRQLLKALSTNNEEGKALVSNLREKARGSCPVKQKEGLPEQKYTISQLKEKHEYFSTILDLKPCHIPILDGLKKKVTLHLSQQYGVTENDSVHLFFHFPILEKTSTLHLLIKVNHGIHPFERQRAFSLESIIDVLSCGKTVDEMILERASKNQERILFKVSQQERIFENVDGVQVLRGVNNPLKIKSNGVRPAKPNPTDDRFHGSL